MTIPRSSAGSLHGRMTPKARAHTLLPTRNGRSNRDICRDPELAVQASDHTEAQPASPTENLRHASPRPYELLESLSVEIKLLHAEDNRVDRIRGQNRFVLLLVGFYQGHQHVEPIVFRSAGLRVPKPLDFGQSYLVFLRISYWFDFHTYTVSASIRSYWA
jgi:hypothetical protein